MTKQIIIAEKHQVAAVFSEDQIQEIVVSRGAQQVGDIYLGIVDNVIPGIDAAFINIGEKEKNGFIHVGDLGSLRLKRNSGSINELLTPQQKVLVQVMKEPTGNKGPRLTGKISLPGRYLVLIPNGRGVSLSRRIRADDERSRLRALGILVKPPGMGLLIRTEADGQPEDAIIEDLEDLKKQWESIQQQALNSYPPKLLDRDDDFIKRVLRDMYSDEVNRIVVDTNPGLKRVKQQLSEWGNNQLPEGVLIDHHRQSQPILEYFRVNAAIREALKPRVDLPSGGYVIIEPTEALTVIDVNSGSFTRSASSRETVVWTNYEAATEIARQLRLRNLGGIIIVDFIDMDSRRDQLKLLEHFNRCLRADKARPQVAQLSELGLVELTRKRQGQNIYELFGQPCSHCGGLGHLANLPGVDDTLSLEVAVIPPVSTTGNGSGDSRSVEKPIIASVLKAAENGGNGSEEEEDDLELLFHPDYQDQTNSNRRRRRRRGPEPVSKEKDKDKEKSSSSRGQASEPAKTEKPSKDSPTPRSERPTRRKDKALIPLSVVMSDLEQKVFAEMGLSPLLNTDHADDDPKRFELAVITPEEAAPESNGSEPNPVVSTIKSATPVSSTLTIEPATITPEHVTGETLTPIASSADSETNITSSTTDVPDVESDISEASDANANIAPPLPEESTDDSSSADNETELSGRRRRRRRSRRG